MDAFRQPKYAYHMFSSQRSPQKEDRPYATGPMVYIAHEMTPFSPSYVTVYSNCDTVRLQYNKGGKVWTYIKPQCSRGIPSPIITFKDVYDFMVDKHFTRKLHRQNDVFLRAEGIQNGKVVATHEVYPARRPSKLLLWVDNQNQPIVADGSQVVTIVAAVADAQGNIKHLNNEFIRFDVRGEASLVGDASIEANPTPVRWGLAPALLRTTTRPGKVVVTASVLFKGSQKPVNAELILHTIASKHPMLMLEHECPNIKGSDTQGTVSGVSLEEQLKQQKRNTERLKEVERQQSEFGEKR